MLECRGSRGGNNELRTPTSTLTTRKLGNLPVCNRNYPARIHVQTFVMNIKYVLPSKFISPSRVMIPAAPLFRSPPRVSSTCTRSYVIVPLGDTDDDLASDNSSTLRSSTTPDLIATAESFLNHGIGIRLGLSTNELPFETNPTFVLDDPYHSPPSVLQPNFSSDPFPALPSLRSDRIRLRVFTHRSYFARPGHVFEDRPNDPSPDNEK